jgi:hypothetical protein
MTCGAAASLVYVQAPIDLATGKLSLTFRSSSCREGGHLGWDENIWHSSPATPGRRPVAWIRSMETGQLRELKPAQHFFFSWSPDGRELLTSDGTSRVVPGLERST